MGRILDVFLRRRVVGVAHACARSVALGGRGPAVCFFGVGTVALGTDRRVSAGGRRIVSRSGIRDLVAAGFACRQPRADDSRFQRTAPRGRDSLSVASAGRDGLRPKPGIQPLSRALARIATKRGHEDLARRFRAPVVAWHLVATLRTEPG